jgi:dsDNA-binding SOS-regulon protein
VQNNCLLDLNQDDNEDMMDLNAEIHENALQQAPQVQDEEQVEFIAIGMP